MERRSILHIKVVSYDISSLAVLLTGKCREVDLVDTLLSGNVRVLLWESM